MNKYIPSRIAMNLKNQLVFILVVTVLSFRGVQNYGFADDYTFMVVFNDEHNPLFKVLLGNGRPIYFLVSKLQFSFIGKIDELWILHLLSSIILLLLLISLSRLLCVFKLESNERYLLVLLPTFFSPAFLEFVVWIQLFPALIGIMISIIAANKIMNGRGSPKSYVFYFILGLPFLIYQPIALFSVCFLITVFCFFDLKDEYKFDLWTNKKELIKNFGAFAVGPVASLILILLGKEFGWVSGDRSELVSDFGSKLAWLQNEYWKSANTMFSPFSPTSSLLAWIFLILGLTLIQFTYRRLSIKRILLFLFAIVLTTLPSFLTSQNWASFRSVVLTQIVLLVFYTCFLLLLLRKITANKSNVIATLLIIFALTLSQFSLHKFWITPNQVELTILRAEIREFDCKNVKFFKTSHWYQSLTGKVYYDEYSLPSTAQPWSAKDLIVLICREKGVTVEEISQLLGSSESGSSQESQEELVDFEFILEKQSRK
jgi:hypothetical protein